MTRRLVNITMKKKKKKVNGEKQRIMNEMLISVIKKGKIGVKEKKKQKKKILMIK